MNISLDTFITVVFPLVVHTEHRSSSRSGLVLLPVVLADGRSFTDLTLIFLPVVLTVDRPLDDRSIAGFAFVLLHSVLVDDRSFEGFTGDLLDVVLVLVLFWGLKPPAEFPAMISCDGFICRVHCENNISKSRCHTPDYHLHPLHLPHPWTP